MNRRFQTQYNYDPSKFKGEVNDQPSMTDVTVYESLGEKIARFCSRGYLPSYDDYYSDCDEDPTNDVGFDIMDYDMNEVEELIKASKLVPVTTTKSEEEASTERVGPQTTISSVVEEASSSSGDSKV